MSASELHKKLFNMDKLPPRITPTSGKLTKGGISRKQQHNYTPGSWREHWSNRRKLQVDKDTFCVYECGEMGPILLLLHGGGFSALSWTLFSKTITSLVKCRAVAMDIRSHGDTHTSSDKDMSLETLSLDVKRVVEALYGKEETVPNIILIGHSMGGAVAVEVAHKNYLPTLIGLAVIDVVEGTALDALCSMQSVLRGRPTTFPSLEKAIEWSYRSGQVRNLESTRVSMVGQLQSISEPSMTGVEMLDQGLYHVTSDAGGTESRVTQPVDSIAEEEEVTVKPANNRLTTGFTWRINLMDTEPHWTGWFKGLSQKFLSVSPPKLLLLAGVNRLDTDLTVGQMQGKFQMQILPQSGHCVHEDVPDKVADAVATFLVRHKYVEDTDKFNKVVPCC